MNVRQYLDIAGNPTFDEREKKRGKGKERKERRKKEREGEEERKARFSNVATSGLPGNVIFVRNFLSTMKCIQSYRHLFTETLEHKLGVLSYSLSEFSWGSRLGFLCCDLRYFFRPLCDCSVQGLVLPVRTSTDTQLKLLPRRCP